MAGSAVEGIGVDVGIVTTPPDKGVIVASACVVAVAELVDAEDWEEVLDDPTVRVGVGVAVLVDVLEATAVFVGVDVLVGVFVNAFVAVGVEVDVGVGGWIRGVDVGVFA